MARRPGGQGEALRRGAGTTHAGPGRVRIIGGRWRGRWLTVAPAEGLRPSPDRVRETVFNWLAPYVAGSRVLDLYSGSGAFGLEALSRGAAEAVLVDESPRVVETLRQQGAALSAPGLQVLRGDVLAYLAQPGSPFDIVFADPPYGAGLLQPCCQALHSGGWLKAGALVYLEAEAALGEPPLPEGWTLLRSKRAGQVGYHLAQAGH